MSKELIDERTAFEDWYCRWMGYPKIGLNSSSFSNRTYDADDTEHLWRGWQAGRSMRIPGTAAMPEPQEVSEEAAQRCASIYYDTLITGMQRHGDHKKANIQAWQAVLHPTKAPEEKA